AFGELDQVSELAQRGEGGHRRFADAGPRPIIERFDHCNRYNSLDRSRGFGQTVGCPRDARPWREAASPGHSQRGEGLMPDKEQTRSASESESPAIPSPTPKGGRPRTNKDWWPNQLDLSVLHHHSHLSNPMEEDFNYAEQFKSLDVDALKKDLIQ